MTSLDAFSLPITNADKATADGYDAYVREYLSYGKNLRELFACADAAPDCALVNAHSAALHLAFEGAEGWANAEPYVERFTGALNQTTERERLFCEAVLAWRRKDFFQALTILDELTVRWPADLCAIKWGQYHAFNLGDQSALLRFGQRASIVHENTPYVHGMIAFALEQNHRIREAEEEGLRATEIAIDDAWAHHAVAHVMETEHRPKDGVTWLEHCSHTWREKGVFIREHNWWHTALFQLQLGDKAAALKIFDEHLWGEWPEFPQEQIGAVSLLWRLEMHGVEVGERWAPVVDQVRVRANERLLPFHDVHYVYALARDGARRGCRKEADELLASIRTHAEGLDGPAKKAWREALLPAAEGATAFALGDYEIASERLSASLPSLQLIGGSHAQRHLFVEARDAAAKKAAA